MLLGKLEEAETKLAKAASIVLTRDKELADLKETMKGCEQAFYNMGFTDAKNLVSAVVFQARRLGFLKSWMATVNAIGLPKFSTFRDPDQIPLPNDLPVQAPTRSSLIRKMVNRRRKAQHAGVGQAN